MKKLVKAIGTTVFVTLVAGAAIAADSFAGTWSVQDTNGKDFNIMLAEDGTATADREGEGMTGTWKADGDAVVISWKSGWTTKIMKDGDGYKKAAYGEGAAMDGDPTNTSPARKAE